MIAYGLFFVLVALSARCFIWGLLKPDRLYQFPTLFGAAWLFYIVPQALGAVTNPDKYPAWMASDGALELALLMCAMCVQAGWMGYHRRGPKNGVGAAPQAAPIRYSDSRLFIAAIGLYVAGMYAAYMLAELTGGFVEQFSGGGHYALEWRGLTVRYVFFTQLIYLGLAIAWPVYLYRPSLMRAIVLALFSIYPVATTIFLGRRAATAFMLLIIFVGLYLARRWIPPRPVVLAGFVLMAIYVVMAPQYRTITQYGIDMERLREVQIETSLANVISGREYAEFDALVAVVASLNRDKSFTLGTGFYNATIGQLVPRQLVGDEIKDALTIDIWGDEESATPIDIPFGSNPTGVANAFVEFWFFGILLYYFGAMAVRRVWDAALESGNFSAQIWYLVIAPIIPISVVGSLLVIPGQLLGCYAFIAPMLRFARLSPAHRLAIDVR
jgi:hypothetical protein